MLHMQDKGTHPLMKGIAKAAVSDGHNRYIHIWCFVTLGDVDMVENQAQIMIIIQVALGKGRARQRGVDSLTKRIEVNGE